MFTTNKFLGGKVLLKQNRLGLCATSDSVLVAALVPIKQNETILDVGAGNGIVGLCVNARKKCRTTAIEIQKNLCQLIQENALLNKQEITIFQEDIFSSKDAIKGQLFNHIVTNPPFYEKGTNMRKSQEQRKAYVQDFDLKKWIEYCLKHLRAKGSFCLIHRPEMLGEILSFLSPKLGNIEIFPIVSKEGKPANRILIRGYLNKKGPLTLHSPLIMHTKDNKRTELAEKILRFGEAI